MELPTTEPLTALGRHRGEAADDTDFDDDDTEDLHVMAPRRWRIQVGQSKSMLVKSSELVKSSALVKSSVRKK